MTGLQPASQPQARDQIESLEESLDFLLKIMAASVSYLSRKAPHIQMNPDMPLAVLPQAAKDALVDEETMVESAEELVQDLMLKSKEVEKYIQELPDWSAREEEKAAQVSGDLRAAEKTEGFEIRSARLTSPSQMSDLESLQKDMRVANKEYRAAVTEASKSRLGYTQEAHGADCLILCLLQRRCSVR